MADSTNASTTLSPTPGAKMMYLIKRRPATSREELVAHWFGSHMPSVIQAQHASAEAGKPHATRYIATLFDADSRGERTWDGVAQLWWDKPLAPRPQPHGTTPADTFQQKAEPYVPWVTTEYVVMEGADHLKVEPLTLNDPFPCTRSGFFKMTFLVKAKEGTDFDEFFAHWLNVHVPNVTATMEEVEGFRYVVSHSSNPQTEPFAGMAELYFPAPDGWKRYNEVIKPDGMEKWIDGPGMVVQSAVTEMIGLP